MASNEEVVREHMRAMVEHDLDAAMEGYAEDAVMLFGLQPVVGRDAIRTLLSSMPEDAGSKVTIDVLVSHGEYVFVVYHEEGRMHGGDSFHIRDGKIAMQSAHVVGS